MNNHIHCPSHGNLRRALRPDVRRVVNQLVRFARLHPHLNHWSIYGIAKDIISRSCGWDAPAGRCDSEMYDLAVAAYVAKAGL